MSHQDRREPLPKDYQFPTHGVECDCPSCRSRLAPEFIRTRPVSEPLEPDAETPWAV